MNELLGWYGYCNSNSNSNNDRSTDRFNSMANVKMSTPNFAQCLSQSTASSSTTNYSSLSSADGSGSGGGGTGVDNNGKHKKSPSIDDIDDTTDSMSAVDGLTKMSPQMNKDINTTTIITNASEKSPVGPQKSDECGWCKRVIPSGASEFSATSDGLKFCSESCFTQSRRASYKRAKTCDWCKHIRHAVSYVDFQDGASQLQFCSDKCLNQYKMQIFCKETQAHIDLNPHLKDKGKSSNDNLITPELWMRNCRSRSLTPVDQRSNDSRTTESPIIQTSLSNSMPTIKIAPVSKLLPCESDTNKRQSCDDTISPSIFDFKNYSPFTQKVRTLRKRRTNRLSSNSSSNLSENTNNNDSNNENRNIHGKIQHAANIEKNRINNLLQPPLISASKMSPSTVKPSQIHDETSVAFIQRYQLMSQQSSPMSTAPPNLFAMNENRSLQNALRQSAPFIAPLIPNYGFPDGCRPPSADALPKMSPGQYPLTKLLPMLSHHQQLPEPISSIGSTQMHSFGPDNNPIYLTHKHQKPQTLNEFVNHVFGNITPPSTLLLPYPIILPLPLPIPIPLPYEAFLKAANANKPTDKQSTYKRNRNHVEIGNNKTHEQPLDFTKDTIASEELKITDDESNIDFPTSSKDETYEKNDLARFRASRQSAKRTFTKESTSEYNRPLRKRKRIIDCDYMRLKDCNTHESRKSI